MLAVFRDSRKWLWFHISVIALHDPTSIHFEMTNSVAFFMVSTAFRSLYFDKKRLYDAAASEALFFLLGFEPGNF
jgi:hypothetical protein